MGPGNPDPIWQDEHRPHAGEEGQRARRGHLRQLPRRRCARAGKDVPKAQKYEDYTKLLADPKVQAVIIATPTGTHKEIALAALAAGKHVYCEAPLANTIDDAKAIAKAARVWSS
jgi:predicted dehydrogenase